MGAGNWLANERANERRQQLGQNSESLNAVRTSQQSAAPKVTLLVIFPILETLLKHAVLLFHAALCPQWRFVSLGKLSVGLWCRTAQLCALFICYYLCVTGFFLFYFPHYLMAQRNKKKSKEGEKKKSSRFNIRANAFKCSCSPPGVQDPLWIWRYVWETPRCFEGKKGEYIFYFLFLSLGNFNSLNSAGFKKITHVTSF